MEKNFESSFLHQYSDLQLAHLNFSYPRFDIGQQYSFPTYMTPQSNEVPMNGNSPFFTFSGLLQSKSSQPTEPLNWLYCSPPFYQGVARVSTSLPEEKLAPQAIEYPNAGTASAQKRFLVFDQSGDQTTLIYSSANATPVQCPASLIPTPPALYDLVKVDPEIKKNEASPFGHFLSDEYFEESTRDDVESEMREDTEELNALLYSDDDNYYSEDDEETSTGHSPSTMTTHDLPEWFDERGEEVASSAGPTKRHKLLDGSYDAPSLRDTTTSAKAYTCSDLEDDAQSSCGNGFDQVSGAQCSPSGKKRLRKDKIRDTISILQEIIPGGKGKDSMVVIDEAIRYLRSLKVKAKSLGLDSL
ncbi:transcription factor bHLH143 [Nicotiana tabacum]|uniref:Transcription factor bHLH143 n=1 Tax=Nicotiana tabacum TaxID=4097 RepID=A0A1S3XIP1_TOBAC|nr:transcription factor bHLH143-like [Nicotiana tomentosiformis]XP_009597069.1 transcription factor bHLH143-like [Nicotiana tomentosiformis]XP_016439542.1 PREDICTED: transcription factor bHLH143-like [Nicotiana tabacum]XP_016439543.1 PREDICTED: transcription factor bHLH143-like [Nicotiana tabacum]